MWQGASRPVIFDYKVCPQQSSTGGSWHWIRHLKHDNVSVLVSFNFLYITPNVTETVTKQIPSSAGHAMGTLTLVRVCVCPSCSHETGSRHFRIWNKKLGTAHHSPNCETNTWSNPHYTASLLSQYTGCTLKNKTHTPTHNMNYTYEREESFLLSNSFQFWSFHCLFKQNLSFDQRLQLKYLSIYIFLIKKSKSKFIITCLLLLSQLLEAS